LIYTGDSQTHAAESPSPSKRRRDTRLSSGSVPAQAGREAIATVDAQTGEATFERRPVDLEDFPTAVAVAMAAAADGSTAPGGSGWLSYALEYTCAAAAAAACGGGSSNTRACVRVPLRVRPGTGAHTARLFRGSGVDSVELEPDGDGGFVAQVWPPLHAFHPSPFPPTSLPQSLSQSIPPSFYPFFHSVYPARLERLWLNGNIVHPAGR
jgi:hypothetical protein